jgi:hypothetical protein
MAETISLPNLGPIPRVNPATKMFQPGIRKLEAEKISTGERGEC